MTMTKRHSIFFDEWQACLHAHYVHVVRTQDAVTEPTLRHVLLQTGLDEADVQALHEQAQALGLLDPGAEPEWAGSIPPGDDAASDDGPEEDDAADGDTPADNGPQLSMF
jgi:hypothetical protein